MNIISEVAHSNLQDVLKIPKVLENITSEMKLKQISIPLEETLYDIDLISSSLFSILYYTLISNQKHAPRTRNTIRSNYDYIIVGAGSAGSTLASRLSEESCVSVLLLEAGKSPPVLTEIPILARAFVQSDIDWNYKIEPQKNVGRLLNDNFAFYTSGKVIGGGSVLNDLIYSRGSRHIYDKWNISGWNFDDLLPYFKKMEKNENLNSVDFDYHGDKGPITVKRPEFETAYKSGIEDAIHELRGTIRDVNGQYSSGFYNYQETMRKGQRCSTAKAYLASVDNRTNLDIVERAFVKKIIIKNHKAIGVQFERFGKTRTIFALREIILSAGSIRTPQLLILSGIGPKKHLQEMNIPVLADLPVGQNFHDHAGTINIYHSKTQPNLMLEILKPQHILEFILQQKGLLTTAATLQYVAYLNNEENASPDEIPDYQLLFLEGITAALVSQANLKKEAYIQTYLPHESYSQLICASLYLQPKSFGEIKVRSLDPKDPPIIDPNYFSHPEEYKAVIKGLQECDRLVNSSSLKALGLKPVKNPLPGCEKYDMFSEDYYICQIKSLFFSAVHGVGSAKMGYRNDKSTVVDLKLRVKGIKNLRVVDGSVIPYVPSGNINAPIIAIAEKAADLIKETISCQSSENSHSE